MTNNPNGHVTIGDLVRNNNQRVWIYCRKCGHNKHVEPMSLGLPEDHSVPDIGKRMVCSDCGNRQIHSKPEVYPAGAPTGSGLV